MHVRSQSANRFGLKLLYAVSLIVLFVYVAGGPATATSIICGGVTNYDVANGTFLNEQQLLLFGDEILLLNVDFLCNDGAQVDYSFDILASVTPNSNVVANVILSLYLDNGSAWGWELADLQTADNYEWGNIDYAMNAGMSVSNATLLTAVADSSGNVDLGGHFTAFVDPPSLAYLFTTTAFDLTITPNGPPPEEVPEPGEAIPLIAGLGAIEYLRRKSRC